MHDNFYSYFQIENAEGTDYLFVSEENKRIYTVSFDESVYADYSEKFPTLLKHGYGALFSYTPGIKFQKGDPIKDAKISQTIVEIMNDFLKNRPESTFIVFECPDYKHEKFFDGWFNKTPYKSSMIKAGITIEFDDDPSHNVYFGFITQKKNTHIDEALAELTKFSISLSK